MPAAETLTSHYEGIVVPRVYFQEFLGALVTDADSQGIRKPGDLKSTYPAGKIYRDLSNQVRGNVSHSDLAADYIDGRPTRLTTEINTSYQPDEYIHFEYSDVLCVENGLRLQIASMRACAGAQSDLAYRSIGFSKARRQERLADLIHTTCRDSQFNRKFLPIGYHSRGYQGLL